MATIIKPVSMLLLLVLLLTAICGCTVAAQTDRQPENQPQGSDTAAPVRFVGTCGSMPEYDNRDTWNISMKYVKYDKFGIWIEIRDDDNIGYHHDPYGFLLEYRNGSEWVNITDFNNKPVPCDYAVIPPREDVDYASANFVCSNQYIDQSKLVSGHYRFTKLISGREFQCEFDLEI